MNTTKSFSVILAAGLAGVAMAKIGNAAILASLPGDALFAVAVSLALASIAFYDYSRRYQPLQVRARLFRPSLPSNRGPQTRARAGCECPRAADRAAA